jgi:uroporphyrinogen III methyltransferase / synthase
VSGRVHLVGAGPGDPGLLSARARELIATADVILYDRLIPSAALEGARADAELLFVGKQGGGESVPQEQTTELLIDRARAGRTVVRLKGGDPFVFGRGGEEALALRAAGIPYEIVPGVTAGVAAAAYAGIPVTHRGLATAVALVTGHTRADDPAVAAAESPAGETPAADAALAETALDWTGLAAFPGTLVFYMGVRHLPDIAASLIAAGRDPEEPVAIVERGTLPGQRTVTGTLATIARIASAAAVRAPAITVVGAVAGLAEELAWLPDAPLSGLTVAVTRARASASELARRLEGLGARVIQAPAIRAVPLPGPAPELARYDLLCLTSPVGVEQLFARLEAAGRDARALAGVRVAAIGPGTAAALGEHGVVPDVLPERAVAEGLVQALADLAPPVRRALIARAREGRETLPDALREGGAEVDVLALYETVADAPPEGVLREALTADYVTFTSASTVRFLLQALGEAPRPSVDGGASAGGADSGAGVGADGRTPADGRASTDDRASAGGADAPRMAFSARTRLASIGPVTSAALRERGLRPDVEAAEHDIDGLVQALVADAAARR